MESVSNLFEGKQSALFKTHQEAIKGEPRSRREELITFFVNNIRNQKKQKYSFVFMKMKVAHLSDFDLESFVSQYKDIEHRRNHDAASKYFWWALKAQ